MGSYTFRWPYQADEVFVTGTFDDWGKTVKLDKTASGFEKEVSLPLTEKKIQYKFVVDGIWTTDSKAAEEDDGSSNINNILHPEHIRNDQSPSTRQNGAAIMSGVTPESTTAGLAGNVPKESGRSTERDPQAATISSAAPESTTADLAGQVPLVNKRTDLPGTFPETPTPSKETEQFSVNPIPASSGIGNPIKLNPGEKVPDPSTINANTVQSTVDNEGYKKDASASSVGQGNLASDTSGAFGVPPVTSNIIPESGLPMGEPVRGDPAPVTLQSAGPTSTTAGLAGAVPLESQKPVDDVPARVRDSLAEAHRDPEAAANKESVEEKKEVESELQKKVHVDESAGIPAPTTAAATTETAPRATVAEPESAQLSPRSTSPAGPKVTTGVTTDTTPEVSGPAGGAGASSTPQNGTARTQETGTSTSGTSDSKKKKNRVSGFFSKLKEKLK